MDAIGGWFAGKAAEKEMNSVNDQINDALDTAQRSVTNWWDSMMGKAQKPLTEFLKAFGFPPGLLPKNITKYKFEPEEGKTDEGTLSVSCPFPMEVKFPDGTLLQFRKVVTAQVTKGKMTEVQGIRLLGITWTDIKEISCDGDKVKLQARLKNTKPASLFKTALEGVEVSSIK